MIQISRSDLARLCEPQETVVEYAVTGTINCDWMPGELGAVPEDRQIRDFYAVTSIMPWTREKT